MSKPGYDVSVKDGDTDIRVTETTGCRCMSCEDFSIEYDDHDPEDPLKTRLDCYKYGHGSDNSFGVLYQTIDALARRVFELEEAAREEGLDI